VLALFLAQNAGLLPRPDYSPKLLHWFVLTITYAIVGSLTYFSNRITMQAFKHANEELRERQRAERDLKIANEELQKRVMEVEKLQLELREQALHDPLTGLYNRRYLDETLSREILGARQKNDCLSIIMADIDNFKTTNDTYGHRAGDLFLVEIALLLKREVRETDIVCRYGGEEFVLVLPGATVDSAEKRAEEIRQKCAQLIVQHEGKKLSITLSFGTATYPTHGEQGGEEIIMKADHALYDAKRMGRNQVRIWGNPIDL
jgi:diguanylate cyclase (GGDEF)-like protein